MGIINMKFQCRSRWKRLQADGQTKGFSNNR